MARLIDLKVSLKYKTSNFLTLFYDDKLISLLHVKSFKSVYELKREVVYKTPQEPNITTCL